MSSSSQTKIYSPVQYEMQLLNFLLNGTILSFKFIILISG